MKRIAKSFWVLCAVLYSPLSNSADLSGCSFNGTPLHGKVKIVSSSADIKVQVVDSFEDLKVKVVEHFPNECGKWQFVNSFPDFTVQYVRAFPDVKIRFVDHFPGVN